MELGQVVFSKAGHDQGSHYIVVEKVDENYVRIADGENRKINRAKLKKVKHLKTNGDIVVKIAEKLKNGDCVFDTELQNVLRFYNEK